MAVISRNHQIICITHLPQIASQANAHYLIEKNVEEKGTTTRIRGLSYEESVEELARMLGGAKITEAVLQNAAEMKRFGTATKKYKIEIDERSHTKKVHCVYLFLFLYRKVVIFCQRNVIIVGFLSYY